MADLVLVRHGETEWTRTRRHTGRTDIPLTAAGEAAAKAVAPVLSVHEIAAVRASPLARAHRTAELAGLTGIETDPDLQEWDYGGYEGITSAEIKSGRPGWSLWDDGVPPGASGSPGEDAAEVGARADRVLARVEPLLEADRGDVVLVGHGHALRVLAARWLGLPPEAGKYFALDTATVSRLGFEHGRHVIRAWNVPVPVPA
jgi:broad specificity phosphatase PhoE